MYESETGGPFDNCVLVTAGRYLLTTDNDGLFLVFETPLAQTALDAKTDFEIHKLLEQARDVEEKDDEDRRKKDAVGAIDEARDQLEEQHLEEKKEEMLQRQAEDEDA